MTKNYWTDRDAVYDQTAVCCNYMNVFFKIADLLKLNYAFNGKEISSPSILL